MAQVAKDRMGVHQRQVAVLVRDEKLVWSEISVQADPNSQAFYPRPVPQPRTAIGCFF